MRVWRDPDRSSGERSRVAVGAARRTWLAALLLTVAGLLMITAVADAGRAASVTTPVSP